MSEIGLIAMIIPACMKIPHIVGNIPYFGDAKPLASDTSSSLYPHQTNIQILRKEMKIKKIHLELDFQEKESKCGIQST